jgi:hypothetical protein
MPDHPSETTARSLTLVAKVVQNLVNMTEFGHKEGYMMVCNPYLQKERPKIQAFITSVATASSGPPIEEAAMDTRRALASIVRNCVQNTDTLAKLVAKQADPSAKASGDALIGIVDALNTKIGLSG